MGPGLTNFKHEPSCAQYSLSTEKNRINALIENAIVSADAEGCKVISLGMLNKVCMEKNPSLNLKSQKKRRSKSSTLFCTPLSAILIEPKSLSVLHIHLSDE